MNRILLVEPKETLRLLLQSILSRKGFNVIAAESGNEGIRLCYEFDVDLVICNGGMTSLNDSFVSRLHLIMPEMPILVLGRVDDPEIRSRALREGASEFLDHDGSQASIHSTVDYLLSSAQSSASATQEPARVFRGNSIDEISSILR